MAASELPIPAFHFSVEAGFTQIGFTEVSGLEATNNALEYRVGSSPTYATRKLPGMQTFPNIVLKRGMCAGDNELAQWFSTINLNTVERRDLIISLLNQNHEPVFVWKVNNAFPVRVTGPLLNAVENQIAFEEIEITHEGIISETL